VEILETAVEILMQRRNAFYFSSDLTPYSDSIIAEADVERSETLAALVSKETNVFAYQFAGTFVDSLVFSSPSEIFRCFTIPIRSRVAVYIYYKYDGS
jgi:hypothetical protein